MNALALQVSSSRWTDDTITATFDCLTNYIHKEKVAGLRSILSVIGGTEALVHLKRFVNTWRTCIFTDEAATDMQSAAVHAIGSCVASMASLETLDASQVCLAQTTEFV